MRVRDDTQSHFLGMEEFFTISRAGLEVQLCYPSKTKGYYRGTRFDSAGIFRRIVKDGIVYADKWYDADEPYRHDNVCGCSEEFVLAVPEQECDFVKIGVGMLHKEAGVYDRFKRYEIVDEGQCSMVYEGSEARFSQLLKGYYEYSKNISIDGNAHLHIGHRLKNLNSAAIDCYCYNHNFWNLSSENVGPHIRIDFPYQPSGTWREVIEKVSLEENSIIFHDYMLKGGKSAFIGDLSSNENFAFTIRNTNAGIGVQVCPDHTISHSVFWSNDRVACIEPYAPIFIAPGEEFSWGIEYTLL